ncbi:hypothetical protein [Hymenobacter persicinus]|uniref:Uncharacterized protein n=1 Tax=Hymenobacter persicinus TaxID=2025506 RepID=A0A4Q5LHJ6_9BACT|nr:hypothetical protein [Hymenobacter persicinus]RYU83829.1 hypothetical protein EWM57_02490 [Hymenobacter persicinus]
MTRESIDAIYQRAVNAEAQKLLAYSPQNIVGFPDYGSFTAFLAGKEIPVGFWHYCIDKNFHHIFFKAQRKTLVFMHKQYISGIKMSESGIISLLSDTELAEYD